MQDWAVSDLLIVAPQMLRGTAILSGKSIVSPLSSRMASKNGSSRNGATDDEVVGHLQTFFLKGDEENCVVYFIFIIDGRFVIVTAAMR